MTGLNPEPDGFVPFDDVLEAVVYRVSTGFPRDEHGPIEGAEPAVLLQVTDGETVETISFGPAGAAALIADLGNTLAALLDPDPPHYCDDCENKLRKAGDN